MPWGAGCHGGRCTHGPRGAECHGGWDAMGGGAPTDHGGRNAVGKARHAACGVGGTARGDSRRTIRLAIGVNRMILLGNR